MSNNAACKVWNKFAFLPVRDNGETISVTVQFDINHGPGQGAVFVNKDNHGMVEIELAYGRRVNGPLRWFHVYPEDWDGKATLIVKPDIRLGAHSNDIVTFEAIDEGGFTATMNIMFEIDYELKTSA